MAVRGAFLPRAAYRQSVYAFHKADRYRNAYILNLLPFASSSTLRKTFSIRPLSASRNVSNNSKAYQLPGYATSFALFEGLWEAGITACFVDVGSDHPSVIEAIVKGKRERPDRWLKIITYPSEITAISRADGYARVTGRPQAVIVLVDVGTQALGQGIHNASVGRVPVFIFAGLCPYTESGELSGSRTEYMHWLQEPAHQKAIVRQYCRYTGEIRTGLNVKQTIGRLYSLRILRPRIVILSTNRFQYLFSSPMAAGKWTATQYTAVTQLVDYIKSDVSITSALKDPKNAARGAARVAVHEARVGEIASKPRLEDGERLDPDRPGSWINCGGTGIGWSNGAVLGVKMALADLERDKAHKPNLVCQVVGDGSFMCAAPSSALWVASKYEIPVLTVVLNNGGQSHHSSAFLLEILLEIPPNLSTLRARDHTSFRPTPNYAALAEAAAGPNIGWENTLDNPDTWIKGLRVETVGEFIEALHLANLRVAQEGKGMLIEVSM
ncbi:hypothetical protein V502_02570 [Pseudogymnoascus sp. VKM F-4520 (FW-2644)]|nr:hypothetical protein V502_02570 [Pseudogymnoascus sp. VKM F-4520 (FW-2644)]